jgi:TonB family protein
MTKVRHSLIACTLIVGLFAASFARSQEQSAVPSTAPQPNFTITRHGTIVFEANIAAPDENSVSRIVLTETIEIGGVKNGQGWVVFVHAFANSTARALLDAMPASANRKKGKVIVEFTLHHDGSLNGAVSIAHSSGDLSVDAAARLAVAKSSPFHALPEDFSAPAAQLRVTFAYIHPHPLPPTGGGLE